MNTLLRLVVIAPLLLACGNAAPVVTNTQPTCAMGQAMCNGVCQSTPCTTVVLASGQKSPAGIAVDGTRVYWTSFGAGTVNSVPLAGGAASVVASGQSGPSALAIDQTTAYWTNEGDGTVMSAPLGGGTAKQIADMQQGPWLIATGAMGVVWGNQDGRIFYLPAIGGTPLQLALLESPPTSIAVAGSTLYWTDASSVNSMPLDIDGADLTMVSDVEDAGENPLVDTLVLASSQNGPSGIAVDATKVYWTNIMDGTLMSAPLLVGKATQLAMGQVSPRGLLVDAANVYWLDYTGAGSVQSVSLGGGTPAVISASQPFPQSLAMDGTNIYWTTFDGGTVVSAKKQ